MPIQENPLKRSVFWGVQVDFAIVYRVFSAKLA